MISCKIQLIFLVLAMADIILEHGCSQIGLATAAADIMVHHSGHDVD